MKMSDSESKTMSTEMVASSADENELEMEDEDQEGTYDVHTSDEDVDDEDEEVDCEDVEHHSGSKGVDSEERTREHHLHHHHHHHHLHHPSAMRQDIKTEKKLSFSVASLLGKDDKDSDDSNTDRTSCLRYAFDFYTVKCLKGFVLIFTKNKNKKINKNFCTNLAIMFPNAQKISNKKC